MSLKMKLKRWLAPLLRALPLRGQQLSPQLWGLTTTPDGGLAMGSHSLATLANAHGTPLHVHAAATLRTNLAAFAGPELYFSYKTHPVPAILRRLHAQGAGAEVISEMELELALRLGVPPAKIIFNGPAKSDRSLRIAIAANVGLINLNHREELPRIVDVARQLGRRVRLGIRVNVSAGWTAQFGTPINGGGALALFAEALATPEVQLVALHAHRGVLFAHVDEVVGYVDELLAFMDVLEAQLGWTPEILDVGGSLAVGTVKPYSSLDRRLSRTFGVEIGGPAPEQRLTPQDYVRALMTRVTEHAVAHSRPLPRVAIEPGRALTGNTQCLVTRVVSVRDQADGSGLVILDAGINIASILVCERHQIFAVAQPLAPPTRRYRLAGPICQPGDVICDAINLPALKTGDLLAIMDSGAYFESDSTVFSFLRPGTLIIDGDDVICARRAETLDDMMARDIDEDGPSAHPNLGYLRPKPRVAAGHDPRLNGAG